jgi:hypothetical protein
MALIAHRLDVLVVLGCISEVVIVGVPLPHVSTVKAWQGARCGDHTGANQNVDP